MFFDVSEMKSLETCSRQWQLTSRNAFHLRPKVPNSNLSFGTLFHECLAKLYLGGDVEKIVEQAAKQYVNDVPRQKTIKAMLYGYADEVLPDDLDRYEVLDIEHRVHVTLPELIWLDYLTGEVDEEKSVYLSGSLDMLALDRESREVWVFEHKTAAKFRPPLYTLLDAQPRVYYLELVQFVMAHNQEHPEDPWKIGGVFINEVQKVQRFFRYKRTPCKYTPEQVERFMPKLIEAGFKIRNLRNGAIQPCATPGYMTCQMCDVSSICEAYLYEDVNLAEVLEEFVEEYEVRSCDHLDEKSKEAEE